MGARFEQWKERVKGGNRTVTVTVPPVSAYSRALALHSLSDAHLLEEIKRCMGTVTFSRQQTNREMRERLLPALLELRNRTYRKRPGFYETLTMLGFNSATVRQWFRRSHTEQELLDVMEGQSPPRPRKHEAENAEELYARHLWNLSLAELRNQQAQAKKLARQAVEAIMERQPFSGPIADDLRRARREFFENLENS